MSLVVLIGAQAVGKMTVGEALAPALNGRLLFNHQTLDLFANYLGYDRRTFQLSDQTRKALFRAFVADPAANPVDTIIFTVMIDFNSQDDLDFLQEISEIFLTAAEPVYFVELQADLLVRLQRNRSEHRLAAKPSKRDLAASEQDLRESVTQYRLTSQPGELAHLFPEVNCLVLDNTGLAPTSAAQQICQYFSIGQL